MTKIINLTPNQNDSVNYDGGDLLIKGVAGSGKSVVVMQRALRFNKKAIEAGEDIKIMIFVYNKSLVKYTNEILSQLRSNQIASSMISVSTIDNYAYRLYTEMNNNRRPFIISDSDRIQHVEKALQNHLRKTGKKHRFHEVDAEYWADEFKWIKQKNINNVEEYLNCERAGRGSSVRISREDRRIVYDIFIEYYSILTQKNIFEWEDIYRFIVRNQHRVPSNKVFDYVLVDEAQDLSVVKLLVAKALGKRPITIAADKAQKIYSSSFTWKELGIDIRGKGTKSLHKPFRSTKQIVQLAESLLEVNRNRHDSLREYTDSIIPDRTGSMPSVFRCTDEISEKAVIDSIIRQKLNNNHTIGILYRSYNERMKIERLLKGKRIPYEMISSKEESFILKPGVKISTLHSAKGLEFDTVIIPFFLPEVFPLAALLEEQEDEEQRAEIMAIERSLLYVGMTRAKYDLYITFSGRIPSPFLGEFIPEYYKFYNDRGMELAKRLRKYKPEEDIDE